MQPVGRPVENAFLRNHLSDDIVHGNRSHHFFKRHQIGAGNVLQGPLGIHGIIEALVVAARKGWLFHDDLAIFNRCAFQRNLIRQPGARKRHADKGERDDGSPKRKNDLEPLDAAGMALRHGIGLLMSTGHGETGRWVAHSFKHLLSPGRHRRNPPMTGRRYPRLQLYLAW